MEMLPLMNQIFIYFRGITVGLLHAEDIGTITTNRSDGDGALGFGFRLQDYIFDKSIIGSNKGYVGYKWAGDVTYDDCFGSYSFIATSYYIHTYSTATLDSITFGIQGKQAGLNIIINNSINSFTGFSNDTRFAIG